MMESPFLNLPLELRDEVYSYILKSSIQEPPKTIRDVDLLSRRPKYFKLPPGVVAFRSLLRCNRQIQDEVKDHARRAGHKLDFIATKGPSLKREPKKVTWTQVPTPLVGRIHRVEVNVRLYTGSVPKLFDSAEPIGFIKSLGHPNSPVTFVDHLIINYANGPKNPDQDAFTNILDLLGMGHRPYRQWLPDEGAEKPAYLDCMVKVRGCHSWLKNKIGVIEVRTGRRSQRFDLAEGIDWIR